MCLEPASKFLDSLDSSNLTFILTYNLTLVVSSRYILELVYKIWTIVMNDEI